MSVSPLVLIWGKNLRKLDHFHISCIRLRSSIKATKLNTKKTFHTYHNRFKHNVNLFAINRNWPKMPTSAFSKWKHKWFSLLTGNFPTGVFALSMIKCLKLPDNACMFKYRMWIIFCWNTRLKYIYLRVTTTVPSCTNYFEGNHFNRIRR